MRALSFYLDRAALQMNAPDALWLVDYGFAMPGVVSSPPLATESASMALEQELWAERVAAIDEDPVAMPIERAEGVYHLVQDRPVIEMIMQEELPQEDYYEALGL